MKVNLRNLRAVSALAAICVFGSACSVMPFQGDDDGNSRASDRDEFVAAESVADNETDSAQAGDFGRDGEGAPGNLVDNPGGERSGSAGLSDVEARAEDIARGQDVGAGDTDSREVFDNDRRRDVEYQWLKDRGVVAMQSGDLRDARRYFERALDLKPSGANQDVKDLLDEVGNLLSDDGAVAPRWSDVPSAAQEEYELEAARTHKRAKEFERNGQWSEAIDEWEKLRRLIKYAPYGAELERDYKTMAQAGLDLARSELQRQRKNLEAEALMRERRMRDLMEQAEEDRRKEEIVELWRQAVYNLELRRFRTAEQIVDQILYLDPQFRKAEELKNEIADRLLIQLNRDTFERRMAGYKETMRQLREAMVPQVETLRYPTGVLAERIRARRSRDEQSLRRDDDHRRIENVLESNVMDLIYEGVPLREVISDIRRRANINIELYRDVEGDEEVNIALTGLPVGNGLNIILNDMGLETMFRHGVLFVIEEDSQDADVSSLVTRVHDVRDLTFNISEFVGPQLRLIPADDGAGGPNIFYPSDPERTLDIDRIEELVIDSVSPDSWDDLKTVRFFGGQLVATQTPAVQAELRDFLDELRQIAGLMVNMEVRFISVEDDYLQDFGIDFRGLGGPAQVPNQANIVLEDVTTGPEDNAGGQFDNGSGGIAPANPSAGIFFNDQDPNNPPVNFNQDVRGRFEHIFDNSLGNVLSNNGGFAMQFAYFVDLTQINAVITAVQKRKKARILTAPRLSAFNTQRANITIVNQIPYIRDFDLQTATTAAIANPVVDTILDGMVLDVKPTVSNDRRFITIEVQPTVAELVLPIPTFTTTLGPTSAVTIQIPEISLQTVQTTVRVPDGGAVVIAGLKTVRDKWVESGVPILSDIPLLGILFRRQGRSQEKFNLVIVVHAKVIDLNDEEARRPGWDN